ncbi:MAG: phosphoribosyltransferase family protein [Cyanobacteriota bacterium]|nr:phosphoribosyltransferase family protein [Cyanobacteriota bacterium]
MEPLPPLWIDREDAGRQLAGRCADLRGRPRTALVGLPRGGVAVAAAMAAVLDLPLHSWSVRKLSDPAWPELAIGAVAPGGVVLWAEDRASVEALAPESRRSLVRHGQAEMARRQRRYGDPAPEQLQGRHLIVVDDGIATGFTARAALLSLGRLQPASLTLAVPVLDRLLLPDFERLVQRLVALAVVRGLEAVGIWYQRFEQLDDAAVIRLLSQQRHPQPC